MEENIWEKLDELLPKPKPSPSPAFIGGLPADCRVKIRKPHPHAGTICRITNYVMNDDMIGWFELVSVGDRIPFIGWYRDKEFEVLQDLPLDLSTYPLR